MSLPQPPSPLQGHSPRRALESQAHSFAVLAWPCCIEAALWPGGLGLTCGVRGWALTVELFRALSWFPAASLCGLEGGDRSWREWPGLLRFSVVFLQTAPCLPRTLSVLGPALHLPGPEKSCSLWIPLPGSPFLSPTLCCA